LSHYHAEVIGSGIPVLFLPAGGFTGEGGRSLAEELRDDFEVHLLDLPRVGRMTGGHFVHWNPAFPIEQVRQFLQTEKASGL